MAATVSTLSRPRTLVVDADTHIIEPPDLWTSRLPRHLVEQGPKVDIHPQTGGNHWHIGQHWLWPVGHWGQAGSRDYPPVQPRELDEIDPAGYDAKIRLERMDEYGIDVGILYPNLVGFQAPVLAELGGELATQCLRVYNDFLIEWCATDAERLIPIAMLPYWDREESVREMTRCVELGHRGVLFANKFERIGLPNFCDEYWDPVYAAAQEMDIPVNFHVAFATPDMVKHKTPEAIANRSARAKEERLGRALSSASATVRLADEVGRIVTSGVCERFPRLKLVSVESGFGYIPFYLEALDWSWKTGGPVYPGDLLPSDYFRRQCFGTLWFETTALNTLENYPDNFMFSTDFPHPTSLSPGPASPADVPIEHIRRNYGGLPYDIRERLVGGNAVALYKLGSRRTTPST